MGMQPVISESAESIAEENGCRNDEPDLGIASRGDQSIGLGRRIGIFGVVIFRHD